MSKKIWGILKTSLEWGKIWKFIKNLFTSMPADAGWTKETVRYLLISFWGLQAILGVAYGFESMSEGNSKSILEYLEYAMPCTAGVLAGAGLYFRDDSKERFFYVNSVAFLAGGFLVYVLNHSMMNLVPFLVMAYVAGIMTILLWRESRRNNDKQFPAKKQIGLQAISFLFSSVIIVWFIVALVLIIRRFH